MYSAVFNSLPFIIAQELFQLSEELKIAGNKLRCGRSKISHPNVSSTFGVTADVWGWALSWSSMIVRESIPRRRFCVPRRSFLSAHNTSALIAAHFGMTSIPSPMHFVLTELVWFFEVFWIMREDANRVIVSFTLLWYGTTRSHHQ